jgi:hypothetical protein
VLLAIALALAIAGVVDHTHKMGVARRASIAEWLCDHGKGPCGGTSVKRIEAAWQRRERAYQIALALSLGGAAAAAWRVRRGALGSARGRPARS